MKKINKITIIASLLIIGFSSCTSWTEIKPEGLLNSNYQRIAKENLEDIEADSIFGIKQRIKSYHYNNTSSIEGFLKVTVFMILYLLIFL